VENCLKIDGTIWPTVNRGFLQKALVVFLLSLHSGGGRDPETQGWSAGIVWYLLEDNRLKDCCVSLFLKKKG